MIQLVIILLSLLIFKPLIILFIPGLLIWNFKKEFFSKFAYIIGLSMSFWIISAWFMRFFDFSFTNFIYITTLLTIILLLTVTKRESIKMEKRDWYILIIFSIIFILRFYPMTQMIVAPGPGDMSEHTYPAKLILEHDGLPESYEPILPIPYFGSYAAGFHTLSAMISILSNIPIYRATFIMTCLTYFLLNLALFVFINMFFSKRTAIITSIIAMFFTTYPQLIFHWGGNPTALSFFFVLLGLTLLKNYEKRFSGKTMILSSSILVASLLTHVNPFLTFIYVFAFYTIYKLLRKRKIRNIILNSLTIILISLILLLPYFYYFEFGLSDTEKLEFNQKPIDHAASINTDLGLVYYLSYVPIQSVAYTSIPFVLLSGIGLFVLIKKKKRLAESMILFFLTVCAIVFNCLFQFLPLTFALMPDRISLFFIIPLSIFLGALIDRIKLKQIIAGGLILIIVGIGSYSDIQEFDFQHSPYGVDRTNINLIQAYHLAIFQLMGGPASLYLFGMEPDSLVTEADLKAFDWIENNIPAKDLFLNNADAGNWIPAIPYKPILLPHAPFNFRTELQKAYNLTGLITLDNNYSNLNTGTLNHEPFKNPDFLRARNVKYIYIGKKWLNPQIFTPEIFNTKPNDFKLIYDNEEVKIYKIIY